MNYAMSACHIGHVWFFTLILFCCNEQSEVALRYESACGCSPVLFLHCFLSLLLSVCGFVCVSVCFGGRGVAAAYARKVLIARPVIYLSTSMGYLLSAGSPNGHFCSSFWLKFCMPILIFPLRATCPTYRILLDLMTLLIKPLW